MTESSIARAVPLTHKEDKQGVTIKLKVFWRTTRFWTDADIADFQANVPSIAENLRSTEYWNKDGNIEHNRFTCEDFAIQVLCQYASTNGLPVRLTTGVRRYGNMEIYNAEAHDRYSANMKGFTEMVMLTYGARDMQRVGVNTVAVASPDELLAGDILAQAYDKKGAVAHHIQLVYSKQKDIIRIYQGNSGAANVTSILYRLLNHNPADPSDTNYTGKMVGQGIYYKDKNKWSYENISTGKKLKDYLKVFQYLRWNFKGFNK